LARQAPQLLALLLVPWLDVSHASYEDVEQPVLSRAPASMSTSANIVVYCGGTMQVRQHGPGRSTCSRGSSHASSP